MISAYGARANYYALTLGDINAVISDSTHVPEAYLEAVLRRERGERFYGMVLADDPRVGYAYQFVDQILGQIPDFDSRRGFMEQLTEGTAVVNGVPVAQQWNEDIALRRIGSEFFALSDAMLVRSWTEYARLATWFTSGIKRPVRSAERILGTSLVPVVKRVRPERPGVVIWAPHRVGAEMAMHLHGLAEFVGDVTCVVGGGPFAGPRTNATVVLPNDPRVNDALSRASVILCAEPSDPADAVAFARLGYGVVAPFTSGAHEFATDIVPWDALNSRFLFTAVTVASARPASVRSEPSRPVHTPKMPERPAFMPANEFPLISVITPTFNRPADLRGLLNCIKAQTYPNIESVIVNDCGSPVDDIVAEYPFARLINLEKNGGAIPATIAGFEHCRGEYIAYVPDDDLVLPDHFERMMNAMFTSGAQVAHGSALLRYLEREESGAWRTIGFNAMIFCETLAPTDSLITSPVGCQQMLVKKSVYDAIGWYRTDSDVADNEIHARMAPNYFYTFPDHVTSEFRSHAGSLGSRLDFPTAMRAMYTELHPTPDRPLITRMREQTIANVLARPKDQSPFPPSILIGKRPEA